jgi:hypothetical protein
VALIIGFDADVDKLIHLYIIGVFTSFTLSQAGMVRRWNRLLPNAPRERRNRMRASRAMNLAGAAATAVVLVIVLYTKLLQGAWIAVLAMTVIFAMKNSISRHYRTIPSELQLADADQPMLPSRNHALILVSKLHLPTMRAIAYAKGTRPDSLEAVTIQVDEDETRALLDEWARSGVDIPLVVLDSPYREITRPLLDHVRRLRGDQPRDVVTVFVPEYVVGRWWEQLLHNQSALRLKARLLFEPGVMLTSVPWQLHSAGMQPQLVSGSDDRDPVPVEAGGNPHR